MYLCYNQAIYVSMLQLSNFLTVQKLCPSGYLQECHTSSATSVTAPAYVHSAFVYCCLSFLSFSSWRLTFLGSFHPGHTSWGPIPISGCDGVTSRLPHQWAPAVCHTLCSHSNSIPSASKWPRGQPCWSLWTFYVHTSPVQVRHTHTSMTSQAAHTWLHVTSQVDHMTTHDLTSIFFLLSHASPPIYPPFPAGP